jgi:hypothetical protein
MITRLASLFLFASCALLGQPAPGRGASAGAPVRQPLPFSHKAHAATGMKCLECHAGAPASEQAGLPETSKCMACHVAIKRESPHVKALAAAHNAKQRIPWVRVHKVPDFVFFSHASHVKAKVSCADCHGPVETRDVLAREIPADMATCMKCHSARGASNECALCHQLGH